MWIRLKGRYVTERKRLDDGTADVLRWDSESSRNLKAWGIDHENKKDDETKPAKVAQPATN